MSGLKRFGKSTQKANVENSRAQIKIIHMRTITPKMCKKEVVKDLIRRK